MKINKKYCYVSLISIFILVIIFAVYRSTYSSQVNYAFDRLKNISINKSNLQNLISKTAYSFYYNRDFIQYDSGNMSLVGNNEFKFRNLAVTPEDLNKNNMVYMDNTSFIFSVYLNSIYLNLSEDANLLTGSGLNSEDIINYGNEIINGTASEHSSTLQQNSFIEYYKDMLEVGDIINWTDVDNNNFFAIFVGDNKCIYADGNNDLLEKKGLFLSDINNVLFQDNVFRDNIVSYSILRPIDNLIFSNDEIVRKLPINSLERLEDITIRRYTNVASGDVYPGEEISFVIEIENNSLNNIIIKKITDVIDSNLELLIINDGEYESKNYNSSDRIITWNNVNVKAGNIVKISYSAKVDGILDNGVIDEDIYGNVIISDNAKIYFNNSNNYMILNDIKLSIYNKFIDYQFNSLNESLSYIYDNSSNFIYSDSNDYLEEYKSDSDSAIHLNKYTFINYMYYNSLGIDNLILNDDIILNSLFNYNDNGYYVINSTETTGDIVKIKTMIPENLYGGFKLFDNNRNRVISSVVSQKFNYDHFIIGDVIVLFDDEMKSSVYLYAGNSYFVSYTDAGMIIDDDISLYEKSLYVVFRPSRINDIKIDNVLVSDIFINFNESKKIDYQISPKNATVRSINFSNSTYFNVDDAVIEGLSVGSDELAIIFNDDYIVNIMVNVLKDVYKLAIDSPYIIDEDAQVIYVGNEIKVNDILENISISDKNIQKSIYDNSGNILTDNLVDISYLKLMSNSELIRQYKIVYVSFEKVNDEVIDDKLNIVKYVSVGTKVNDLKNMFSVYGASSLKKIVDKNLINKSDTDKLVSGDKIVITISSDLSYEYQISVLYDTTGNGEFNPNDVVYASRHLVEWINPTTKEVFSLDPVYEAAADASMNGIFNPNDLTILRRKLVD